MPVLSPIGVILIICVGDHAEQVPGRRIAAAICRGTARSATYRRWSGRG
jgi:hypothetical protein